MNGVLRDRLLGVLTLSWLTGPIFDKELRVSSRRRRNYVLRCLYVVLFTLLLMLFWADVVPQGASNIYQSSRMAQAGQLIVLFVVWFQFIALQIVTIVMLSSAVSDEIYHKTLGLLMTTPVGGLQIVLGKLLSRLLQLMLLLAITLPLLAIIRVFGGVPWDFLVCALCITLVLCLFLGSLSLFFSIFTRRAYTVIIVTVLVSGILFALFPMLALLSLHRIVPERDIIEVLRHVNPYVVLGEASEALATAGQIRSMVWLSCCGVCGGASVLLTLASAVFVRSVALRQATGQSEPWSAPKGEARAGAGSRRKRIRRVTGPPVFWKECRRPLWGRRKALSWITAMIAGGLLVATYVLLAREDALAESGVHISYGIAFTLIGLLYTAVLPATGITTEKESRAWPVLLTTTVGDWAIVASKFGGVIRRCLPAWGLLFAHVTLFVLIGIIHPIALIQLAILMLWALVFLSATGLYFSSRFRHTTAAVIANAALAGILWAVLLFLLVLVVDLLDWNGEAFLTFYVDMNPIMHAGAILDATVTVGQIEVYHWTQDGISSLGETMRWLLFCCAIYGGIGMLFLWRAKARLRRNPF